MDRRDDILRHFPTLLGRWRGAHARLWTLSASHPTLVIVLFDPQRAGSLTIACTEPDRIESPRYWTHSNISVEIDDEMFRVVDPEARLRITRCGVEIKEFSKAPWQ